jgi:hypothetical protein
LLTLHTVIAQRKSWFSAWLAAMAIPLLSPAAVLAIHCAVQSFSHEALVTWVRHSQQRLSFGSLAAILWDGLNTQHHA